MMSTALNLSRNRLYNIGIPLYMSIVFGRRKWSAVGPFYYSTLKFFNYDTMPIMKAIAPFSILQEVNFYQLGDFHNNFIIIFVIFS